MKPFYVGKDENGRRIELGKAELQTHVHGIGASRTGKSKLIEWIAREMIRNRQGFCLIDPHGFLYNDIVRWLAVLQPKREIILFEPASEGNIVGFNPFQQRAGSDLSVLVDRRVQATVKVWGAANTDATPRLERWIRCLYWALMEQGYPLDVARYFLSWNEREIRDYLIQQIRSETVRGEWSELIDVKGVHDFWAQIESVKNRLLFRFIEPTQIRRTMGLSVNNIDIADIIETGKILLVNLQPQNRLSQDNARLIGTLLLSEFWETAKQREQGPGGRQPSDFYLIIDEFQLFLTPDIPQMLDQAAKYGLHLFLFHQHLAQLKQLDEQAYGAVMTNAQIKTVFGGLSREDARTMAEQIFAGQVDLKRVKHLVEQTKFWPVYGRDTVHTRSSSTGSTDGLGSGERWNAALEEWVPGTESMSSAAISSEQEGEADIPIFRPEPFKEVSSVTHYSLEELLWQLSDSLMQQYQRHYMIRIPGMTTRAAVTPYVKSWRVRERNVGEYTGKLRQGFLSAANVDKALFEIHDRLSMAATGRPFGGWERNQETVESEARGRHKNAGNDEEFLE